MAIKPSSSEDPHVREVKRIILQQRMQELFSKQAKAMAAIIKILLRNDPKARF